MVSTYRSANRWRMKSQIPAELRHPHIISALDFDNDSNLQPHFTMPFLQGARGILNVAAKR